MFQGRCNRHASNSPLFENLEERLLLTTLHGGDFFVYHNTAGETIRVTLNGDANDRVELLAYDDTMGGVCDLVGLLNGTTEVVWPDGSGVVTAVPAGLGVPAGVTQLWVEAAQANPGGNPSIPADVRGSRTEIYSIFVASCSPSTTLTVTRLDTAYPSGLVGGQSWTTAIDPWSTVSMPAVVVGPTGNGIAFAPSGSGSAVVGVELLADLSLAPMALLTPSGAIKYLTPTDYDPAAMLPPIGAFPGGTLRPGVVVSDKYYRLAGTASNVLGSNVQGIVAVNSSTILGVDLEAFLARPDRQSPLGGSIMSLAADGLGNYYAVDNAASTQFLNMANNGRMGNNVNTIAMYNNGGVSQFYAIDETTHQLLDITDAGVVRYRGTLIETSNNQFRYDNVIGLSVKPGTSELYGLATQIDLQPTVAPAATAGIHIILINTATGRATTQGTVKGLTAGTTIRTMTFMPDGANLIAVTNTGNLITVDPTTGASTTVKVDIGITPTSITYVGNTLYAFTATRAYTIDDATGDVTDVTSSLPAGIGAAGPLISNYNDPGYFYTAAEDANGYFRLARLAIGSSLRVSDGTTATTIGAVVDAVESTYVYRQITGLDFDGVGNLIAVGTLFDSDPVSAPHSDGQWFISIDTATGLATRLAAANVLGQLSTLAFDAAGNAYSVNLSNNNLVQVDLATGDVTPVARLRLSNGTNISNVYGLDFATIGGVDALYAISITGEAYAVDPATAVCQQLGDTLLTDVGGVTYDPSTPGILWYSTATELGWVSMTASLVQSSNSGLTFRVGGIFDSANPNWGYEDILALDMAGNGTVYAVGRLTNINPFGVADPADFGPYLITIDTATGVATRVTPAQPIAQMTSITIGDDPLNAGTQVMFGVRQGDNCLVRINLADSTVTDVGAIGVPGVQGIDLIDGRLIGVTDTSIYTISPTGGQVGLLIDTGLTGIRGLSEFPFDPNRVYVSVGFGDVYYLMDVVLSVEMAGMDMGVITIAGTVIGGVYNELRSIDLVQLGYLWGNIDVDDHLGNVILRFGGGGIGVGVYAPDDGSLIHARGTIGMIDVRSGQLSSAVHAENDLSIAAGNNVFTELETVLLYPPGHPTYNGMWLSGYLVDYRNDDAAMYQPLVYQTPQGAREQAQFINHVSGTFSLYGWTDIIVGDLADWYALPMMAGQTLTIYDQYEASTVVLRDADGHFLDSYGFETEEDWGVASHGDTLKTMSFTAPAAGVYYLEVEGFYNLIVTTEVRSPLGGLHVIGDYIPLFTGVGDAVEMNIAATNGGDLGAVAITGLSRFTMAAAIGGGDVVSYQVGSMLANIVQAEANVGLVEATAGTFYADVLAGDAMANANAQIQNLRSSGDMLPGRIYTTGSIGTISVGGTICGVELVLNIDRTGLPGFLDLIEVGGDWGDPVRGIPSLRHGPGGDIGVIHVTGNIWAYTGGWTAIVTPTTISNGRPSTLNDDGGGRLIVTPQPTLLTDAAGAPILDAAGLPMSYTPTYSYVYIGVDDYVGGVGGVIANLTVNGSMSMSGAGSVDVSYLDMTSAGFASQLTIGGTGQTNLYYVETAGHIGGITNTTQGNLVSGTFLGGIDTINIAGTLGPRTGHTDAKLFGHPVAPISGNELVEPQFGYNNGRINGLDVQGDLLNVSVGGALNDLRVTGGKIGRVTVNSDKYTAPGHWDGVAGVIWSDTRIDSVEVGDGLADDGTGYAARAAILCSYTIGTVTISGPTFTVNDTTYGQLQGSIFGQEDIQLLVDAAGQPILDQLGQVQWIRKDAVEKVIGVNGATCTALIGGSDADAYKNFKVWFTKAGGVGTVSFSGPGAMIDGSEIFGKYVRKVTVSVDGEGIFNSWLSGDDPLPSQPVVGDVQAGGRGIENVTISSTGGDLGNVRATSPFGQVLGCVFASTDGMRSLSGHDLRFNELHMPGTVGAINATGLVEGNIVYVGAVTSVAVGENFEGNDFTIAGELGKMTVGGFFDSVLVLQGPTVANLASLAVAGHIFGLITSAGRIGSISAGGDIFGEIQALRGGWNADVDSISAGGSIFGDISVGGSLKSLTSGGTMGNFGGGQSIEVWGDLGNFVLGAKKSLIPADFFAEMSVGGNIANFSISGTLFGDLSVNGNVEKLTVSGGLGGEIGGNIVGSVNILGSLGALSIPTNSDLLADLTVGDGLKSLSLKGGSIVGDVTSRFGSIDSVSVTGGDITGDLTAVSFGKISVSKAPLGVTGNITATGGDIGQIAVKEGDLTGDISVPNGRVQSISVAGPKAGLATASGTWQIGRGLDKLDLRSADLSVDLISGGDVKAVSIRGGTFAGTISSDGRIDKMSADVIDGGVVRAAMGLGQVSVGNTVLAGLISSGRDVGSFSARGDVTGLTMIAGYDVGSDCAFGGGDPLDPTDTARDNLGNGLVIHCGSIGAINVGGVVTDSILSAGMGPGVDGDFWATPDDEESLGLSTIGKAAAKGGYVNTLLLADTGVDAKSKAAAILGGATVYEHPAAVAPGAIGGDFTGTGTTFTYSGAGLLMTLRGGGTANYNVVTGDLVINGATSRSQLTITSTGAGPALPVNIVSQDDCCLGSLTVSGLATLGDVDLDGGIGKLTVATVAGGSQWRFGGEVKAAKLPALTNVDVTVGGLVGKWDVLGAFSGSLEATAIKSLTTQGDLSADVTATAGAIDSLTTKPGNLSGTVVSSGGVKKLTVAGDVIGEVQVNLADLQSISVTGAITGSVSVPNGSIKTLQAASFGGAASPDASIRAGGAIGTLKLAGNFEGLLSAGGAVGTIDVSKGDFSGRAWAGRIARFAAGSMTNGLLASSSNIDQVGIAGNMIGSMLLAGFCPGDGGVDPVNGEVANNQLDGLTDPALFTPANGDHPLGGRITKVVIGGNMGASTIAAGISPGADGFVGTTDDILGGTGYIGSVDVKGAIYGTGVGNDSYGVFASSNLPAVTHQNGRPFLNNWNARVEQISSLSGNLRVLDVSVLYNSVVVQFNLPINSATIDGSSFQLLASTDDVFLPGDTVVSAMAGVTLSVDNSNCTVTLQLASGSWQQLQATIGSYFQLTLDGDVIAGSRDQLLDGEFVGTFPSGNSVPGGDFVYNYEYGQVVLAGVPAYLWYHGCTPTAAGMLVGYYDGFADYNGADLTDLIAGDATTQTAEVDATIASQQHIDEYALYDGVDDYGYYDPYPDLSTLNPAGAHADNSLADFLHTSMSAFGNTYGATTPTDVPAGIEDFFAYTGHTAEATGLTWNQFSWTQFTQEINAGRPMLLSVDSDGDGSLDHAVIGIGYDMLTHQYACLDTYTDVVQWHDFQRVTTGQPYGISRFTTVVVTA